jgi:hypothetical protein
VRPRHKLADNIVLSDHDVWCDGVNWISERL